jgi:lysozyme family protein
MGAPRRARVSPMSDFDTAFTNVVDAEKGLSTDPSDPGNWTGGAKGKGQLKGTKFGISAATYPAIDIAHLTLADAKTLYRRDYWIPAGCDALPWPLNYLLFDTVVNQGGGIPYWRAEMQRALGVTPDGNIGPTTTRVARNTVVDGTSRREAVGLFVASRIARYATKSDPSFQRGLFKRVVVTSMRCAA